MRKQNSWSNCWNSQFLKGNQLLNRNLEENRLSNSDSGGKLLNYFNDFGLNSSVYYYFPKKRSKKDLRVLLQNQRSNLSFSDVCYKSIIISRFITDSCAFQEAKKIGFYSPIKNEVLTHFLFSQSKLLNKDVYFPKVVDSGMDFYKAGDLDDLKDGKFGIKEPFLETGKADVYEFDMILMPGLGFDRFGNRLGYGGGFYDKKLCGVQREKLFGLAYDFQVLDFLPHERHDVQMGFIATECGLVECKGGIKNV